MRLRDLSHFLQRPHITGRTRYAERCEVDGCREVTKRHIRLRKHDEPLYVCDDCIADPRVQRSLR